MKSLYESILDVDKINKGMDAAAIEALGTEYLHIIAKELGLVFNGYDWNDAPDGKEQRITVKELGKVVIKGDYPMVTKPVNGWQIVDVGMHVAYVCKQNRVPHSFVAYYVIGSDANKPFWCENLEYFQVNPYEIEEFLKKLK